MLYAEDYCAENVQATACPEARNIATFPLSLTACQKS